VSSIHTLLTQPLGTTADALTTLLEKLKKKTMAALEFVAEDLKAPPIRTAPIHSLAAQVTWRKEDVARGLIEWVSIYF
jgi:hypothetical protein